MDGHPAHWGGQNPAYRPAHRHTRYYVACPTFVPHLGAGHDREAAPEGNPRPPEPAPGKRPVGPASQRRPGPRHREAQTALDVFAREVAQGLAVGTRATLGKLLDEWLANLERIGRARATLETYRVHVEKHIRPALGSVRLDRLSAHDLDRYF